MSQENLLIENSSEDEDEEPFLPTEDPKEDLVIDSIGSFGPYHLWLCLLGFLLNVVHSWLSLSLKFVGLAPKFTCGDWDPLTNASSCERLSDNTLHHCSRYIFSEDEVKETIVERWGLVCEKAGLENVAQSVFFAGCLIGVFLAGILADLLGRKFVCIILVLCFAVTGVLGGLVTNWYVWLALRFLVGAASIGMVTVRYTIQVEMTGGSWRSWANTMSSTGWVLGYMTLPVLAYLIPNMRHMEVFIGISSTPLLLLLIFCHPESPRWLLSKGNIKKAVSILNRVASWNRKKNNLDEKYVLQILDAQAVLQKSKKSIDTDGLVAIFSHPYPTTRRNLIIMCYCWFSFGMAYFGLALHTPELGSNVFLVFFLGGLMDVPTIIIGPVLLNQAGRKPCMVGGLTLGALCLLVTAILSKTSKSIIVMAILGKVGVGLAFDTGYVWTSEMFPTVIRNSALSTCSSFARFGAIVAPLIVFADSYRPGMSLLLYGLVTLIGGLLSCLLQPETKSCRMLPDSLEEGEISASRPLCRKP